MKISNKSFLLASLLCNVSNFSKIFLLASLLCSVYPSFGQTFQTAIGYPFPTDERGASGVITPLGNYLVLGGNRNHPSGFFNPAGDLQLVRLNPTGNLIQPCRIIGQDVAESATWIENATDCNGNAGFIIAGNEVNGGGQNMLLTLTNSAGVPQWVRRIGTPADDEKSACVKQDGAGNFILIGTKTDANTGISSVHAVKTDCTGNLLWERVYTLNGSATAASVSAFTTLQMACPNMPYFYFVTGTVSAAVGGNEEVFILSLNVANGNTGFVKTYDIAPNAGDFGTCIQGNCAANPVSNGGLWVSGYSLEPSGSDPKKVLMLQTDLNGNPIWANNYDVQNSPMEFATHFQFAAGNKLVLTGKAEETGAPGTPETGQCLLMRMTDNGAPLDWTRVFTMGFASQGNRVEPTAADEYFISGHTYESNPPQQFDYNILAIKTDQQGQTGSACFHSPATLVINRNPVVTNVTPTIVVPQDFKASSLLNVLYDEKQTFCPKEQINPCDTLALSAAFNSSSSGNTFTFTDLSTVGSGSIFSWQWDFGDSNTSGLQNPVHTYSGPGVYTVCLVITGGTNGAICHDTICKDVVVKPQEQGCLCDSTFLNAVTAGFNIAGTNPVTLTPVALDSCDQVEWIWGDGSPNTYTSSNAGATHTYSIGGTYYICMVVTRIASDGTVCKREFCKAIQIPEVPQVCEDNIVLNGTFTSGLVQGNLGSGGTVSSWSTAFNTPQVISFDSCADYGAIQMWGNQVVGEGIGQPVTFQAGITYQVSFCGMWLNTVQDSVRIRFRASVGSLGSYFNCTAGTCDEIFLSPVLSTTWSTYTSALWTPTQNYNTLNITIWNNYALNDGAYVSWARIDDICIRKVGGTTAAGDLTEQLSAKIFPNPTGGDITLEFGEALRARSMLVISDLYGRTLQQLSVESGQTSQTLSLQDYPAGIYLIRLTNGNNVIWTGKAVKE